jgi:hypothetical protein
MKFRIFYSFEQSTEIGKRCISKGFIFTRSEIIEIVFHLKAAIHIISIQSSVE